MEHQRGPRRWVAAGVVAAMIVATAAVAVAAGVFRKDGGPGTGSSAGSGYKTGTAIVTRRSLTSQSVVNATLGKAGAWTVVVPQGSPSSPSSPAAGGLGPGTFTRLPAVGNTIRQGHVMYRVSGSAVVLLYGNVPAYRDLTEGLAGPDVRQLNEDLVRLGYATAAALGARAGWDYYGAETAYAVRRLQARLGLTETGTLSLGEAVFLPGAALITGWGSTTALGGPATPGTVVVTASSTTPVVTIDLDAGMQSEIKAGDPVNITLPDGRTTPGVIAQISRVASSSSPGGSGGGSANGPPDNSSGGSANSAGSSAGTITVLASLKHAQDGRGLNSAPVTVTITTGSAPNVLTVPVNALLAQTGGGYAVEVTGLGGHHLVTVTPGLFDDAAGLVQVTGNLAAGQHVVVPGL
jgi:peptidoglycan hydrolase-like protein with peptidoglycan-binding domain